MRSNKLTPDLRKRSSYFSREVSNDFAKTFAKTFSKTFSKTCAPQAVRRRQYSTRLATFKPTMSNAASHKSMSILRLEGFSPP